MKTYELTPIDGRKSFYHKAIVEVDDRGNKTLYSYNTPIIKKTAGGDLVRLYTGWSQTTGRHIAAFCGLNKAEFEKLDAPKRTGNMAPDMTPAESYRAMMIRRVAH